MNPAPAKLHIPVEHTTLDNGLRVVASPDHSAPVVTVGVYYQIGFRLEPHGRSGFAHLFEHMMFQGSANAGENGTHPPDQFLRRPAQRHHQLRHHQLFRIGPVERARARSVARSRPHARPESGRRKSPQPARRGQRRSSRQRDEPALRRLSRGSICRRSRFATGPTPTIFTAISPISTPPRSPTCRHFFRTYYAPNNAVLLMLGDLEPAEAFALAKRYFEDIPAAAAAARADVTEPPQTEERRGEVEEKFGPLPALAIGYTMPPRGAQIGSPPGVIDRVLHGGRAGRVYRELVLEKQIAVDVDGSADTFDYQRPHANGHANLSQAGISPPKKPSPRLRRRDRRLAGKGNRRRRARSRESEVPLGLLFDARRRHGFAHAALRSDALSRMFHACSMAIRIASTRFSTVFSPSRRRKCKPSRRKYLVPRNRAIVGRSPSAGRPDGGAR